MKDFPKNISALIVGGLLFGVIGTASAEEESKAREKVKKDLLLPECSWSTMNKAEYDACQKKRQTMKVMTPEERKKYLDHTEPGSVTVTERGGQIGNRIRSGGGVRGR